MCDQWAHLGDGRGMCWPTWTTYCCWAVRYFLSYMYSAEMSRVHPLLPWGCFIDFNVRRTIRSSLF